MSLSPKDNIMKKRIMITLSLLSLLLVPVNLFADAQKQEWFGTWSMNHDGFAGSLRITDSKVDCASSAWCDMVLRYVNDKGVTQTGSIETIDSKGQHMVFYINFPGNRQKFDAYIFSWDKRKLAGTTYWGGRTFGFYATK
jgi:hypothetical protein